MWIWIYVIGLLNGSWHQVMIETKIENRKIIVVLDGNETILNTNETGMFCKKYI